MSHKPSPTRVARTFLAAMSREACIVAAGVWGGSRCLLKNRDRNYDPKLVAVHELQDGVEVLYIRDEITGWLEGLNEFGIGAVNSALLVARDEGEKRLVKEVGKKGRDGARLLEILKQKTLDDAIETTCTFRNGIKGHTFLADPDRTVSVEHTSKHECVVKSRGDKIHVRTNHGFSYPDAGYSHDTDNYVSSVSRRDQAKKVLRQVSDPKEIAPSVYAKRKRSLDDPTNMVRDTDNMRTSSQLVLNLTERKALLYLIPGKVEYLGMERNLPKGYKPKLSLEVYEYTDLDENGEFDVVRRRKTASAATLDMSQFEVALRTDVLELTERASARRKGAPSLAELREQVQGMVPAAVLREMRPGSTSWVRPLMVELRKVHTQGGLDADRAFSLSRKLMHFDESELDPESERALALESVVKMVASARAQMKAVVQQVEQAAKRVPVWQGSVLRVVPQLSDSVFDLHADSKPLVSTATVQVGRDPSFTMFLTGTKIDQIEDVLEGGDSDFFGDVVEQADYFKLIQEIRRPGSSSQGRWLILWTARPVKDRARYESARTLPANVFLTTDADRAYGIARDFGGGRARDLWRAVVNEAFLVQTLESGRVRDYQVIGEAPVRSMELVAPGDGEMSQRLAARWLARVGS